MTASNNMWIAICVTASVLWTNISAQNTELHYSIAEESPAMSLVGNVLVDSNVRNIASPSDISDLRFTFLTEGNSQAPYLWINSSSGELRTSSRINRESICQRLAICELRVQSVIQAQLGAFFKIIHIKVTVRDINDNAPKFTPSKYTVRIAENETPGAFFRIPTATDLDVNLENSVTEYTSMATTAPFTLVVEGSASSSSFDVRIRLDGNLDRETASSYQFFVLAVDGGSPRLTGTLTVDVEVTDVNDNSPVFQQQEYSANISDSIAVDFVVVTVKAIDLDAEDNGCVTYSLPSTQKDIAVVEMFYLNGSTGEVRTKVPMDSYAGRSYRLTIGARDSGPTPKTATTEVVIAVLDIHNSQPEILLNVFGIGGLAQVSELAEVGRAVAHLAVFDPDSSLSSNGQVSCFLNTTDQFQLQTMDVKQLTVILTKRLDREQQMFHSVTVTCEDSGTPPLNASSSFIVEVEDENDNAPIFNATYYTVDVIEGRFDNSGENSHVILTVHASDKDAGLNAQITYRLAEGTNSDFGIYADGSIVVTNPAGLDREDRVNGGVRTLVVLAVDSGKLPLTGTTTVVVTIKDINDNSPKFSEPVYFFTAAEDAPLEHIVSTISATDSDLENNGIVYFKMHHRYADTVPFGISSGGVVKVAGSIDREKKSSFEFQVVASDMGKPMPLSSIVTVRVKVTDKNDNSPKFLFPNEDNYTVYIPHTLSENTAFAIIFAIDLDEGRNSEIVYTTQSGNGSKYFEIEPDSGQVVLVRPLASKDIGLHVLTIAAHDRGVDVQMVAKSVLQIVVYESNVTLPLQHDGLGVRNIVVAVALMVVTAILTLTILLTIFLIRRVDKQSRFYSTKTEEAKVGSKLQHLNPYLTSGPATIKSVSDMTDLSKDGDKKKKEVSFSMELDSNTSSTHTMITVNSAVSDKYDILSDRNKGKLKATELVSHPDDIASDSSGDVSTCDSGKGGSDVELQSNARATRGKGNTSLPSQRGLGHRNSQNSTSNVNMNISCSSFKNLAASDQYIRPDPALIDLHMSKNTPTSVWPRPPSHSPMNPGLPAHRNVCNLPTYNQTVISNENVNLDSYNSRRSSFQSIQEPEHSRNRMFINNHLPHQKNRFMSSTNINGGYTNLTDVRSFIPLSPSSNSCLDEAGTRDCDTTTSGSYTIDPQVLCDEIDTFFFGNIRDIVV